MNTTQISTKHTVAELARFENVRVFRLNTDEIRFWVCGVGGVDFPAHSRAAARLVSACADPRTTEDDIYLIAETR